MIYNAMIATGQAHAVHGLACQVAQTQAYEAYNRIAASKPAEGVIANTDALARCGLSGNGQEFVLFTEHEF